MWPCITIPNCHLSDCSKGKGLYVAASPVETTRVKQNDKPPYQRPEEENEEIDACDTGNDVDGIELNHRNEEIFCYQMERNVVAFVKDTRLSSVPVRVGEGKKRREKLVWCF